MRALFGRASVSAAFVLVAAACGNTAPLGVGGSNNGGTVTDAEYDIALKKWQANAPAHYRIVYQQTCECSVDMQRPTRVTVRRVDSANETIEEVVDAATLAPATGDRRDGAKSVDGLLVLIGQALAIDPQDVRITYDATLGYPLSINIDPVTSISGDEFVYKVTSFEKLP
jgi:uncharacterized protein DUF6174